MELVVSASAVVIALAALVVTIWEGYLNRRHYRLTVTPHLTVLGSFTGARDLLGVRLKNEGTGPAVLREIKYSVDGGSGIVMSDASWQEIWPKVGLVGSGWDVTMLGPGSVIGAGEYDDLISVPESMRTTERKKVLLVALPRVEIDIVYESLYGDRYEAAWRPSVHSAEVTPANAEEA